MERAEALVVAWEAEGDARALERMTAAYWDAGTAWTLTGLAVRARREPPVPRTPRARGPRGGGL